jgi:glyoxylase-like metal-dependent hydrolase (beta-lactamase superfamily II)
LHFNDEEIRIFHLANGHTDGDTVVFFDTSKVASLGDLYFAGMYPIFHPEHNGNLTDYIKNIEFILSQIPADGKIISGHGPSTSKSELQRYCEMLKESVAVVHSAIAKGISLEQIQKIGLPIKWESYSHGYLTTDQWIALVYKSLQSENIR